MNMHVLPKKNSCDKKIEASTISELGIEVSKFCKTWLMYPRPFWAGTQLSITLSLDNTKSIVQQDTWKLGLIQRWLSNHPQSYNFSPPAH